MMDKFFDRLFADKVEWSFHTAMTCDLAYAAALAAKQLGKTLGSDWVLENEIEKIGVFYQPNPEKGRALSCSGYGRKVKWNTFRGMIYEITDRSQTYHAKISLVAYRKNKGDDLRFRLAVYSKNLEFNNSCFETASLFELASGPAESSDGKELCGYICKICSNTDDAGKGWIKSHVSPHMETLQKCSLQAESGMPEARLFFGGINRRPTLGERLNLNKVHKDSIVLTPPEFIRGTAAEKFFRDNKRILYDLKEGNNIGRASSHAKLYLLKRPEGDNEEYAYELWLGSANASASGLGWDFNNGAAGTNASVECLVKYEIGEEQFRSSRKELVNNFGPFEFENNSKGSLQPVADPFGPWVVSNYKVKDIQYLGADKSQIVISSNKEGDYRGKVRTIRVELESVPKDSSPTIPQADNMSWRPAEYGNPTGTVDFSDPDAPVLTYEIEHFRPSQGFLCFGSSDAVMWIGEDLMKNIPQVKDSIKMDTTVTDWLLGGAKGEVDADDQYLNTVADIIFGQGGDTVPSEA